jgi:hypothetical protein
MIRRITKCPLGVCRLCHGLSRSTFLIGFVANAGFPPSRSVLIGDALYVSLWLFFLFLPFFSRIKIGGFLELERQVEQAKQELREFKSEVRNSLSVLSTNVNTIGGMSNHVTVNIPGLQELRDAREAVAKKSPDSADEARQVEEKLLTQSEDTTLALARTRIEIERYLRKILGKRVVLTNTQDRVKLMGARQLFEEFLREYPDLSYLKRSFQYVTQICNAAIHAQYVPDEQAQEALALGAQIIAALNDISGRIRGMSPNNSFKPKPLRGSA